MQEYPETYEEAKQIIIDSNSNEYNKQVSKTHKLKYLFTLLAGVGVAATAGLITGQIGLFLASLPAVGLITLPSLLPIFNRKKEVQSIEDGTFFKKHSPDEVMEFADALVDYNNDMEEYKASIAKEGRQKW